MTTFARLVLGCALSISLSGLAAEPGNAGNGKGLYNQNCAVCHGPEGKGDGPAGAGFNPRPANFSERTSDEARQIRVVTNGGAPNKLSPVMPAWDEVLTEAQIRDVVAYIRENLGGNRTATAAVAP